MSLDRSIDDAEDQPYEPTFFASKYGLPTRLAKTIIDANGGGRRACDAAATTYLRYVALRRQQGR
ncbi:hypothetical protein RFM41_25290 [Mesorhizobium sp. VK25A]|uniref:Uncharacterized protein n=1 Tax=Mesorhizobium vachelliae TaxID=3072309 RepID=A0ABU5ACL8_9HYPH|nr:MULTISPECIES: hypothetical protein [unclassified Mesorhizobium]MDX8534444.1 hypothetical protein [Mesorhizobium sp. VK25D]MDX8547086.1 hypothetical protein [Mesorhizobium sp. VK25A]